MSLRVFNETAWPEDEKWELVNGEARMSPKGIGSHQVLIGELDAFLRTQLKKRGYLIAPEADVKFPAQNSVTQPDVVAFEDGERIDIDKNPFAAVPALTIEVLSPGTAKYDLGDKKRIYALAGVPEYWVVDPLTGALSIFVKPKKGEYEQLPADPDGYVRSPLLKTTLRVSRVGNGFKFLEK
jgi:Uma2 family endonuclease